MNESFCVLQQKRMEEDEGGRDRFERERMRTQLKLISPVNRSGEQQGARVTGRPDHRKAFRNRVTRVETFVRPCHAAI